MPLLGVESFRGVGDVTKEHVDSIAGQLRGMVPELERCFDCLGMRGIKMYPPYTRLAVGAPEWEPIYA